MRIEQEQNSRSQDGIEPVGLRAEKLAAGYGRQLIIDDITLSVPDATMTVLVGPNGSGKSTLLSVMARLLKPMGGSVMLDGKALHAMPTREVARRLGLLPQSPLLPEGLTVYDLVSRGRYPHQGLIRQWTDADEAAVEHALTVTDTLEFANRPVADLSGGQRQRCWIAMALAQETPIILLDEPTTFLDLHYQVEVLELLRRLARHHGRTIIAVLHDLNFALQYADRLVFLKSGAVAGVAEHPSQCTIELVRDVFNVEVLRLENPESDTPFFLPSTKGRRPER
ncbi:MULTISPECIES: ABC transporter ATP-binding protein [unclassified Rhizobium]|jgi:iron complex transport system ATP-binding protein|uniref:ABC transporter ATP-binding protein n=1 Tax=unclassified Rhizobium TaxID=2613769 RepID=UPI000645FFB8|nr:MULTISPECIES: ABC transporter ATP-binding protein [unclassified Rhizobium]MBN8954376.1 ABC transporter ATP-binding protein [Rhizobium tropici]OJY79133.1 MAG: ABC transporter [Rhizobium sp. 60-20]RKD67878.1 iron complex transport system ATP-binding protein [Rhizobium sp. WW_1]